MQYLISPKKDNGQEDLCLLVFDDAHDLLDFIESETEGAKLLSDVDFGPYKAAYLESLESIADAAEEATISINNGKESDVIVSAMDPINMSLFLKTANLVGRNVADLLVSRNQKLYRDSDAYSHAIQHVVDLVSDISTEISNLADVVVDPSAIDKLNELSATIDSNAMDIVDRLNANLEFNAKTVDDGLEAEEVDMYEPDLEDEDEDVSEKKFLS